MQPNKPVILSADRETLLSVLTKSYGALMLRLRQDQVRWSGTVFAAWWLTAMSRRELADVVEFLAALLPAANHSRLGVLQAALGRRHTSRNFVAGIKDASPSLRKKYCLWIWFRVATLWPKTPMASWRSSSCPQRTHHTAGNSASLLPQIWICRDTWPRISWSSLLRKLRWRNKFKIWIAKRTKLVVANLNEAAAYCFMPQRRTHSACFRVSRPRIIIPTLLLFLASLKPSYPSMCMCIHDDGCHLRRYAENRHLSAGCFFPLFRALFVLCVQCGVPSHTGNNQKIFCNIRVVYSFTSAFLNLSVFASGMNF